MKPLIRQIASLLGAAFIAVVIGALPVAKAAVPTDIAERLQPDVLPPPSVNEAKPTWSQPKS